MASQLSIFWSREAIPVAGCGWRSGTYSIGDKKDKHKEVFVLKYEIQKRSTSEPNIWYMIVLTDTREWAKEIVDALNICGNGGISIYRAVAPAVRDYPGAWRIDIGGDMNAEGGIRD